ncbi:amidase [Pseudoprimorskyibacter insulae]|uniref:Glutamyl-tRNA(Gln) amidotransferase subunit A n=1 Tax=Pseudoprimorskyibacter insulae TaxID=1695997 RepID=A0A2R8AVB8_9RHOB|nr:amidase family protein [Pseudoprimorskyibacter insulae]SPF79877.1 Glutamyl-tRNA(Gln) amidotransferase subunit A [Pseudoprimorskyibacter insulae]
MADWTGKSAAELGRGIEAGDTDPRDLTESFLEAIAGAEVAPRIYARLTETRARAEAAAAAERAKLGLRRSPLDGVPISWKDLFDTAGCATEAGSALLKGRVPDADAEVLRNATAMGLVCLGKTHMSELAFSGLGLNPVTATPPCVNDAGAVAGGSSSGAATSVAFRLAAAGIGSDTGGSVRIPAGWNDLVGLKTTAGRVPLTGTVPLATKFDTIGPLTRTVEDAALLLAALEGGKAADLAGAPDASQLRFAVLKTIALDDLRDAPNAAFASAIERLERAGAQITYIDAPEVEGPMADAALLYTSEAWGIWSDTIENAPDLLFPPILERFRAGGAFKASDYVAAWIRLERMRATWAARVAGFDAVLTPTAPNLPPQVDKLMEQGDYYVTENLLTLRNTRIGNLTGGCAITLPTGVPSCGLQLIGPAMGESRLLRVATSVERALR